MRRLPLPQVDEIEPAIRAEKPGCYHVDEISADPHGSMSYPALLNVEHFIFSWGNRVSYCFRENSMPDFEPYESRHVQKHQDAIQL
jgi:hypothetical protein